MSFLQQYGIIQNKETGALNYIYRGIRGLVVDAVLKEYFRTGEMPPADQNAYVDIAMAYVREYADEDYDEEQLREIVQIGAEDALDPRECFVYQFTFNLGLTGLEIEWGGDTYTAQLSLFVEWRHYLVQDSGTLRIDKSSFFEHSPTIYRTAFRTDALEGFQAQQKPLKNTRCQDTDARYIEIPTVMWAVIGDLGADGRIEQVGEKYYVGRKGTKIVSPIDARRILANNLSAFRTYAYSLSNQGSIRYLLYREMPNKPSIIFPAHFPVPQSIHQFFPRYTLDVADNIPQTECCMSPNFSSPEMPPEEEHSYRSEKQKDPCQTAWRDVPDDCHRQAQACNRLQEGKPQWEDTVRRLLAKYRCYDDSRES